MSGKLLENPVTKVHEFSDDLESFLHLLMYMFIRITKSNFTPRQISEYIQGTLVSPHARTKGHVLCGGRYVPDELTFCGRDNIAVGLDTILLLFKDLYKPMRNVRDVESMRAAHKRLNVEHGGREAFQDILRELIQTPDDQWTSEGPSPLIPLPLSQARKDARQLNLCARAANVLPVFSFAEALQRDPVYSVKDRSQNYVEQDKVHIEMTIRLERQRSH
jgi:hypothetical protein